MLPTNLSMDDVKGFESIKGRVLLTSELRRKARVVGELRVTLFGRQTF